MLIKNYNFNIRQKTSNLQSLQLQLQVLTGSTSFRHVVHSFVAHREWPMLLCCEEALLQR